MYQLAAGDMRGEGTGRQEHPQGEERPPPVRRERRGIISFRSSGWIKWMRAVRDECGSVEVVNAGENSMPSPPLLQRKGCGPRLRAALLQYRGHA